jgi:GDPmannose 4,6-dehydratase
VLATGEAHSVREFTEEAFRRVGIDVEWQGSGEQETGRNAATGDVLVEIDPRYYRPTEVDSLLGDASKAERVLGWKPLTSFSQLVTEMMDSDLAQMRKGLTEGVDRNDI